MVDRLCVDSAGQLPEVCQRDNERERYLTPEDHRVGVMLEGRVPPGSRCIWNFDDGTIPPQQISVGCGKEVRVRLRYGKPTIASVGITAPDGSISQAATEIAVRDLLIAGLGDSIASGEGNPDKPVALSDIGFCFRDFLAAAGSQFYRPGRAKFPGDKSCESTKEDQGQGQGGQALREWQWHAAGWMSAGCHRSLYGYQMRAALALAIENPHIAVTFIPLACAGADYRTWPPRTAARARMPASARATCAATIPGQIGQLADVLKLAQRQDPNRKLDLILLTIGANDVRFSGIVADVIIDFTTERVLFNRAGVITAADTAAKITDAELPGAFGKLRAALLPLVGGNLSHVVFTTYGHLALAADGRPCPGGRDGFDVHPSFTADPARLKRAADFSRKNSCRS